MIFLTINSNEIALPGLAWEFASKSQSSGIGLLMLKAKMSIMQNNNPQAIVESLVLWIGG